MIEPVRCPPLSSFPTREKLVMAMIAQGLTYKQIGMRMTIARETAKLYAAQAAEKIPGDLPVMTKIHFWARGATKDQLTGEGWIPGIGR